MKIRIALTILTACTLFGLMGEMHAATISWVRDYIDGGQGKADLAVSTGGTLVEAANFGNASVAPVTINTVPFTGVDFSGGGSLTNLTGLTYNNGQAGLGTATGGSIDTLTDTIAFRSGVDPQTAALTGLTNGQLYEVQFFLRHGAVSRTLTITSGNSVVLRTRSPSEFASGFFTADAATQAITFDANTGSQFLNGYQLRVGGTLPPEPPVPTEFGIDFSRTTDVPLQAGWDSLAHDGTTLKTETFSTSLGNGGDIVVSAQSAFWRDYASVDAGPYANHSDLLSDLILTNSSTQEMTITLDDLKDGPYEITTYHHMTGNSGTANFDILLTDANGTDVPVHTGLQTTGIGTNPRNPSDILTVTTQFEVSGGNSVTLRFDPTTGGHAGVNAFELSLVPEPSTLALAALGLLGLLGWGRRRRR